MEVGHIERHLLIEVNAEAKAVAIAVHHKADILHVVASHLIVGLLHTGADLHHLRHVVLGTKEELIGVAAQTLLMVLILMSVLVEIVVPTGIEAKRGDDAPTGTQREQRGRILRHILLIGPTVENLKVACALAVGSLVLQAHAGFELILGGEIKVAHLIVDTQDRCHTPTGLVAVKANILCGIAQRTEHGGLHGILLSLGLSGLGTFHIAFLGGILSGGGVTTHGLISLRRLTEESLGSVHILVRASETSLDIANVAIIVAVAIEHAQATIGRPVLIELICGTKREAEVILATTHVGVHVVRVDGRKTQRAQAHLIGDGVEVLRQQGQHGHSALERRQAVLEDTLATAAQNAKAKLEAPVVLVVSCLDGGNDRSVGLTLESLRGALVLGAKDKRGEDACHSTRLTGVLQVE